MPIIIEEEQKEPRELHPEGVRQAACLFIEDIGYQKSNYNGKEKVQRKVVFLWETTAKRTDGKPFLEMQTYTASMYDGSNLRRDLEGWAGKKFTDETAKRVDIEVFAKRDCLLNFVHSKDGKYSNIAGITPLMEGMAKMVPQTTEKPEWFVKFIEKKRSESVQPATQSGPGTAPPHTEDDLPF